jgi:hypothetical protein
MLLIIKLFLHYPFLSVLCIVTNSVQVALAAVVYGRPSRRVHSFERPRGVPAGNGEQPAAATFLAMASKATCRWLYLRLVLSTGEMAQ